MNVVWKWLKDYVDIPWDPQEAVDRFTMAGLKVESLSDQRLDLSGVVSAKVLEVVPHPQRPDLKVGTLYDGTQRLSVVSGAPGFAQGNVVLLATPGSNLPGGITVSTMEIAGVPSQGMVVCSNEILSGETHRPGEDIILLPGTALLGKRAQDLLDLDDYVIELELTVNYSHCLSMLGVAIEAAALAGKPLKLPKPLQEWDFAGFLGSRAPAEQTGYTGEFRIGLPDPDLCPKYVGKEVRNITFGYSPVWMERRLMLAGMRPINAVVDVTNYVMLETGQPLHAFDLDKIQGKTISARRSRPGETILTLDGETRDLAPGTLIVADGSGPVAVAGVMGNLTTEVTPSTKSILLESAYFDPLSVRRTYRQMKLRTEAAIRFEKGIDPSAQPAVAERAAWLAAKIAKGEPGQGYAEADHSSHQVRRLSFHTGELQRTLGVDIPKEECRKILEGLRFGVTPVEKEGDRVLDVTVPPRRVDIEEEVDLTEEIARYYGVNYFEPLDLDRAAPGGPPDINFVRKDRLKDILVSLGGLECVTNSLLAPSDIQGMGWDQDDPRQKSVPLMNPLLSNESLLRTSLLPGLIKVAVSNQRSKVEGGLFWEIGRVFFESLGEELPREATQLAIMYYGTTRPKTWIQDQGEASFFGMKGLVESLLALLGIQDAVYLRRAGMPFHPGKSAKIVAGGSTLGEIGEIHPVCMKDFDAAGPLVMAWFSVDALLALAREPSYVEVPRFMPVERDLAVVVSEDTPVGEILQCVRTSAENLVSLEVFDVWRKPPVPIGKKSVAMRLVYQAGDRTLTEEELAEDRKRVLEALSARFGAEQRL